MQGKEASEPEASSTSGLPGDFEPFLCSSSGLDFPTCEVGVGMERGWVGICRLQVHPRAMYLGTFRTS